MENNTVNFTHDGNEDSNFSHNDNIQAVLQRHLSRRSVMKGGVGLAGSKALSAFAGGTAAAVGLSACGDDNAVANSVMMPELKLAFNPIAKSLDDVVKVPTGYQLSVLYPQGTPITGSRPAFKPDGTNTAAEYEQQAGDQHDGMSYYPLPKGSGSSSNGLLVMNHENIVQVYLHPAGTVINNNDRLAGGSVTPADAAEQCRKEIAVHGVSVAEVQKNSAGAWAVLANSTLNRRLTPNTEMDIKGPAASTRFMVTKFSPDGKKARGTINNCAYGYTPWGTYLTCEENWAGYYGNSNASDDVALTRYGIRRNVKGAYGWMTAGTKTAATDDLDRWDCTTTTGAASSDYRNDPNTFGYVIEVDPYNPASKPVKHTALGRFAHESAEFAPLQQGKPVTVYMGDDARNEYIYKFVSEGKYDPATASGVLLEKGTLYAAKFNDDGTGVWIPLVYQQNGLNEDNATYPNLFTSQAAIAVYTRHAADAVGATKMDRPEWTAINPLNGEIYTTLTNNSQRTAANANAANPRAYTDGGSTGNRNGHIIRQREVGDDPTATRFTWDNFVFGAQAQADDPAQNAAYQQNVNLSGLSDNNDMSSPDGLWFDLRGLLWIQTDDGAYTDKTNCMMLAAVPGRVGDGAKVAVTNGTGASATTVMTPVGKKLGDDNLRRFLVGPRGSEITGMVMTPDYKTFFINIQHPGEDGNLTTFQSHWPDSQSNAMSNARPRSATIVVTRSDGGMIGI
jgi:hypothetical protein